MTVIPSFLTYFPWRSFSHSPIISTHFARIWKFLYEFDTINRSLVHTFYQPSFVRAIHFTCKSINNSHRGAHELNFLHYFKFIVAAILHSSNCYFIFCKFKSSCFNFPILYRIRVSIRNKFYMQFSVLIYILGSIILTVSFIMFNLIVCCLVTLFTMSE